MYPALTQTNRSCYMRLKTITNKSISFLNQSHLNVLQKSVISTAYCSKDKLWSSICNRNPITSKCAGRAISVQYKIWAWLIWNSISITTALKTPLGTQQYCALKNLAHKAAERKTLIHNITYLQCYNKAGGSNKALIMIHALSLGVVQPIAY